MNVVRWSKENLFSSVTDTAISISIFAVLMYFSYQFLDWAVFNAVFFSETSEACRTASGACWAFIFNRMDQILYGFYPTEHHWRIHVLGLISLVSYVPFLIDRIKTPLWLWVWSFMVFPILGWALLGGGPLGMEVVDTDQWGGILLTLIVASTGIIASLPFGIALALGRRSSLPVVRFFSVVFIEFWRGVPLITVLFMSSVMLPLFLPAGTNFDKLLRVLIGVTLFSSAYMAEVVRGGLQALPKGQTEAAEALGLSYFQTMKHIVLPQALKHVIPGIVNTFIGLFKDTTLVTIVGMLDVLGIIHTAAGDQDWLGFAAEGYVFTALFFWVCCFSMSQYSRGIERKLHHGH